MDFFSHLYIDVLELSSTILKKALKDLQALSGKDFLAIRYLENPSKSNQPWGLKMYIESQLF